MPTDLHRHVAETGEPRLRPLTLRFEDDALEQHYQREYTPSVLGITRVGLLLAILLYITFGITDLWTNPERIRVTWAVRGGMAVFLGTMLAISWTRVFARHQQAIVLASVFAVALSIALLLIVASEENRLHHVISLVLLIVGSFAVLGLRFPHTMLASVVSIASYTAVDLALIDFTASTTVLNILLLLSALTLAAAGSYNADKQRRLAFHGRLLIEHEREESRHSALHDPLTGLANRRLVMERLTQAVARDNRYKTQAAVMFMDFDDLKTINDTHGHAFGDKLLKEVAQRLESCVRTTDTVARLGGDEFVVLIEDLRDRDDLQLSLARIRACFAEPARIEGVSMAIEMSIGCAVHPHDGIEPRELLDIADKEMYRVKRERKLALY